MAMSEETTATPEETVEAEAEADGPTDGDVFVTEIPPHSPVAVFLIEQEGCGACEEYHPIFLRIAAGYAQRGLPVVLLNAATPDEKTQHHMTQIGVESTPTVVAMRLGMGPIARLDGAASEFETVGLFNAAWVYHRPPPQHWWERWF